jgi:hypothetical protein
MKKIKTFADACKKLKLNPKSLPDVSMLPKIHRKSIIAHYKLIIIIQALNDGWTPNWSDSDEYKYYNYFWIKADKIKADKKRPSGFDFSVTYYYCAYDCTDASSRLCFKTQELADYARKNFVGLYKDYLLLTK